METFNKENQMTNVEKMVLKQFEKKAELRNKYASMSDSKLYDLEESLYALWRNDKDNVELSNKIQEVEDELTRREDEREYRAEAGY